MHAIAPNLRVAQFRLSPGVAERLPLIVSIVLHILFIILLALYSATRLRPASPEPVVVVEILPDPRAQPPAPARTPIVRPVGPARPRAPDAPAVTRPRVEPGRTEGMQTATQTYSKAIIADPTNRVARALRMMTVDERLVQLCNIEAMEQISVADIGLEPQTVVAYAMADLQLGRLTLYAPGGAFFAGGGWYNIRFRCVAQPDYRGVRSFAFEVGEAIPRQDWSSHGLPSNLGHSD